VLLAPADEVRFQAISMADYEALAHDITNGRWTIRPDRLGGEPAGKDGQT
jgi:hypothetical protein